MAARIFGDHGFRHATLEDIGDALDMTRPALYYYTRSKEELLGECAAMATRELHAAVEEAEKADSGLRQLCTFFRHYAESISDGFGRCFVLTDLREMGEEQRERSRQDHLYLAGSVERMIGRGIADGSIGAVDVRITSKALFGAFNAMPRWYRPGGATAAETADALLATFITGLSPRS